MRRVAHNAKGETHSIFAVDDARSSSENSREREREKTLQYRGAKLVKRLIVAQ